MPQTFQRKERCTHLVFLVIFFATSLMLPGFYSCKKADISLSEKEHVSKAELFFRHAQNIKSPVARIAAAFAVNEKKYGFADQFVKLQGVPLWKNALQFERSPASPGFRSGLSDTIIKIPLQLEGYQTIHGYLLCTVSGNTVTAAVIDGRAYAEYGFQDDVAQEVVAEKIATEIMHFNFAVYGINRFKITDNRLFENDTASNYVKTAVFDTTGSANMAGRSPLCPGGSSTVFITTTYYHCTQTGSCTSGICDLCSQCLHSVTDIYRFCGQESAPSTPQTLVWTLVDPADPGGGGAPFPPGWVPTPLDPCNTNGSGPVYTTICGTGWVPEEPLEPWDDGPSNDSTVIEMLKKQMKNIKKTRDSVWEKARQNNWEYFFYLKKQADSVAPVGVKTDEDELSVKGDKKSLMGAIPEGDYHCHQDAAAIDRHPHDPADIRAGNVYYQTKKDFASYVDCGDTVYVVVTQDPVALKNFIRTKNLNIEMDNFINAVYASSNRRAVGLQKLLALIGTTAISGLGLYKSTDANFTTFTKIN